MYNRNVSTKSSPVFREKFCNRSTYGGYYIFHVSTSRYWPMIELICPYPSIALHSDSCQNIIEKTDLFSFSGHQVFYHKSQFQQIRGVIFPGFLSRTGLLERNDRGFRCFRPHKWLQDTSRPEDMSVILCC
jgi:hypothetical protein